MVVAPKATDDQIEWINKMLDEKVLKDSVIQRIQRELNMGMMKKQASQWLGWLFDRPSRPKGSNPEEGFYRVGEKILQVKISKAGNWYAEEAIIPIGTKNRVAWDYIGRGFAYAEAKKLTAQEAGRFTSYCMYCGRHLSDPISRYNGIGPDCADQRGIKRAKPPVDEFELSGQKDLFQREDIDPGSFDDIYWSNEAAKHEAIQERRAEEAKFAYKQLVERF